MAKVRQLKIKSAAYGKVGDVIPETAIPHQPNVELLIARGRYEVVGTVETPDEVSGVGDQVSGNGTETETPAEAVSPTPEVEAPTAGEPPLLPGAAPEPPSPPAPLPVKERGALDAADGEATEQAAGESSEGKEPAAAKKRR